MDILLICTGNVCRTPMAQGFLRWHAAQARAAATVHSVGLLEGGRPVTAEGVRAMAEYSIDTSDHVSQQLTTEAVEEADLIIGMAREHVREATLLVPGAFAKSFTLKELVRRGEQVGRRVPGHPLEDWLEKVGTGRRLGDLLGTAVDDDVADPIGQPLTAYQATASELDDLTARLALLLGWHG